MFGSHIQGQPIDLYVYNADSADLVFGRANLKDGYPRELAHHIGIVRRYLNLRGGSAEKRFNEGAMDIAIGHSKKEVYFSISRLVSKIWFSLKNWNGSRISGHFKI